MTEPSPVPQSAKVRYVLGVLLPQTPTRYLRTPHFVRTSEQLLLRCIAWEQDLAPIREGDDSRSEGERFVTFPVRHTGAVVDAIEADAGPLRDGLLSPEGDALRETTFVTETHRVEITHCDGIATVTLHGPAQDVCVWRARGMAAAPFCTKAEGGVLVAWHHNVREDDQTPDVAKWIALRLVDEAGQVRAPAAPMQDRDRDRDGEEQSFEFPSCVVAPSGAIALFGRGSHNHYRQDLTAEGFGPRQPLSEGTWGSRGRRCAAVRLDEMQLVFARRERKGIEVERAPLPSGGAPAWVPTAVDLTTQQHAPSSSNGQGDSDPAQAHGMHTYFGDIQQHSAHSDGVGSADEVYLRARDHYGDDFVALTDHESFLGKRTGPGEWAYLKAVADRYDRPGHFATLHAYEWTGKMYPGPGHKCVYVPRPDLPILSRDVFPSGRALVQEAIAQGAIASPHHIGWTGCDEDGHDPVGQPTWEICSCHGCYEHADHPLGMRGEHHHQLVDVMLAKGHRFGFTASSDSHGLLWHHGESRKRDPYRTGLTAIQAPGLSRDAIFNALRTRRCYATSGAKILLDFTVDDQPMGSALSPMQGVVSARVVGTAPLAKLSIVGPKGVVAEAQPQGRHGTLLAEVGAHAYLYLRVLQEDGEMAWSSPVFDDGVA